MGASASKPPTSPLPPSPSQPTESNNTGDKPYPEPSGEEYSYLDKVAAQLPNVIDDESRQQVADYQQACDNGKGPMVACFATGEYLSFFERKHKEAAALYDNVCFRPKDDTSPNGVGVDGTMAYPAGCFNLAKMKLTGKGGVPVDRFQGYQLLDRSCRGGHGGACFLQAQLLCGRPGALDAQIPHNPPRAMELYQQTCDNGDSLSCFTLATMLLRGDKVSKEADNVSPEEAQGRVPLVQRDHEANRQRTATDVPYVIPRDPVRAAKLLEQACQQGNHVTSCHNLAVMYTHGDEGVPPDEAKAAHFKKITEENIHIYGGLF